MSSPRLSWDRFAHSLRTSTARSLAVAAPVGAGLNGLVEQAVRDATRGGQSVVIVASAVVLLEQWRNRLDDVGVPVVALHGGSDLLLTLEQDPAALSGRPQAVLLTTALLTSRGRTSSLARLQPDLLILDRLRVSQDSRTAASLQSWLGSAGRVIHLLDVVGPGPISPVEEHLTYSLHEFLAARRSDCIVRVVESGPAADVLNDQARRALESAGLPAVDGASYAELHAQLMRAAEQNGVPGTLLDEINGLLDALESDEQDPRVPALLDIVTQAQQAERPCLVVVSTMADGHYLASLLSDAGLRAAFVSSASGPGELERGPELLRSGGVAIRTRAFVEGVVLPHNSTIVWWARPGRLALAQAVAAAVASRGVELITFEPEVPREIAALLATSEPVGP